jgi:hypothetical protein
MEQTMRFSPADIGPFWMTATEKNERRLDQARTEADPPKLQSKTKRDLAAKLSIPGHHLLDTKVLIGKAARNAFGLRHLVNEDCSKC